jgi:hypothetical protein
LFIGFEKAGVVLNDPEAVHALGPEASTELVATGEDLISMVLIDPLTFFSRFAAALAPPARALVPGQISETAGST